MLNVNGLPVLVLSLALPRVGNWVLDVELDGSEALEGEAVLTDGQGNTFTGTSYRSGLQVGRVHARIMGGRGGLAVKQLDAAHYQSVSARLVAEDAISAAGETIDPSSDPLAVTLDSWSRQAGTCGRALSELAESVGCLWRVLPNGNVWLGQDGSEPLVVQGITELDRDRAMGTIELGLDALLVLPGEILGAERVSRIHYRQSDSHPLRALVWPEAA